MVQGGWILGSWLHAFIEFQTLLLSVDYSLLPSRWNLGNLDSPLRRSVPADLLPYLELGETTLEELRRLLKLPGWSLADSAPYNTSIKRINIPEYSQTIFLTQTELPITADEMMKFLWTEGEKTASWNPTVDLTRDVLDIGQHGRITYVQSTHLFFSRDFVNMNYWIYDHLEKSYYLAYVSTKHELLPLNSLFTRANTGPSGMRISRKTGDPSRCVLEWVFNVDLKMFIPDLIMSRVIPSKLKQYVESLQIRIKDIRKSKQ